MSARGVNGSLDECNPRLNDCRAGPRVTRSSISAPVQNRGYPRVAVDYALPTVGRLGVELSNRSFHYAREVWPRRSSTIQLPPGLALPIPASLSGSLELAFAPGVEWGPWPEAIQRRFAMTLPSSALGPL